jgi:hypothetical protein
MHVCCRCHVAVEKAPPGFLNKKIYEYGEVFKKITFGVILSRDYISYSNCSLTS